MQFRRSLLAAAWWPTLCLTVAACSGAGDPGSLDIQRHDGDGVLGAWVHSGLYNRTYYLHLPPDMAGSGSHPLLVLLHGAGDTGKAFHARIHADAATDAAGYVVAYPDGLEASWTVGCGVCTAAENLQADDVSFLSTLIRQLADSLWVDTTRVFIAGFSQGGQLAQLYACQGPIPPAGLAVVAGSPYGSVATSCAPGRALPVLLMHGNHDPVIPVDGANSGGGGILPVSQMVALWSTLEACDATPAQEERPDTAGDGTTIDVFSYSGCSDGVTVRYDRVNNGGHTWPGDTGPWPDFTGTNSHNMDASAEIVRFFSGAAATGS